MDYREKYSEMIGLIRLADNAVFLRHYKYLNEEDYKTLQNDIMNIITEHQRINCIDNEEELDN